MIKNTSSSPPVFKEKKPDQIIWEKFLSGDDDAYAYIYKQYSQALFSYGLYFTSDKGLVEDSIQDVFIKIYQNRKSLQTTDNIKLYLFIALKNKLFNIFRKDLTYSQIDSMEPVFATEYTIEDKLIDDEQSRLQNEKMTRMLEILTPRQREVIFYRFVEGLSLDEICQIMDMNYQSAQNLIQRSLKKLRTTFSRTKIQLTTLLVVLLFL